MTKFAWALMSSSLFLVKSLYAVDARPARLTYKNNSNAFNKKYSLDTGFKHLNFFHNTEFSSTYATVSPKVDLKNWRLDSFAWFSTDHSGNETFSIKEAYYTQNIYGFNVYLGRRIYEWTKEEELKPTGFWNNAWDFNKSDPKLEGNIGLFIEKEINKKSSVNLFLSSLALPKFVSHNEIRQRGDVVGNTPWSLTPPSEIEYTGLNLPVNYALDDIDYFDLISAFQFGVSFDFDGERHFFKTSYLYAPSKDLDMGLDFVLDSSDQSTPVEISILPQTYNVHRFGLDFGIKWSNTSSTGFSFNHRERVKEITNDLRQSFIGLSSGSVFQLYHKADLVKNRLKMTAFINENTQIVNETNGELGELLESYLSIPFRFVRGGGLKFKSFLNLLNMEALAYYDVELDGFLGRFMLTANLVKKLNAHVGVDVVEALNSDSQGFYKDFRKNDFVYGGVTYAF